MKQLKTYLNRSQLARLLNIVPETLRERIARGEIRPDAEDGKGNELFLASKFEKGEAPEVEK